MKQKGFTLIELMIVIAIIAIIAAIAIPNLIEARKGANESSAVATLRTVVTAQALYRDSDKDSDGSSDYAGSLANLRDGKLVDTVVGNGTKSGFVFTMVDLTDLTTSDVQFWSATAKPQSTNTGNRRFYVDDSGVIRFLSLDSVTVSSTELGK